MDRASLDTKLIVITNELCSSEFLQWVSASINPHPLSALHYAGLGPVVLCADDGKCNKTVKLATQTDNEIQTLLTVQHQLSQLQHHLHLHSCNVQHHIPKFTVKSPLKEKLKVWNIVFVRSSLQCLLGAHDHEKTYMRNVAEVQPCTFSGSFLTSSFATALSKSGSPLCWSFFSSSSLSTPGFTQSLPQSLL